MSRDVRMRIMRNDNGLHRVEQYIDWPGVQVGWKAIRGYMNAKGVFTLYTQTTFERYDDAVHFMNAHYAYVRAFEASHNWRPVGPEFKYVG